MVVFTLLLLGLVPYRHFDNEFLRFPGLEVNQLHQLRVLIICFYILICLYGANLYRPVFDTSVVNVVGALD